MDKMTSVLLAIGEENLSSLLRKVLVGSEQSFDVLYDQVLHRRFLFEMVAQVRPDILIVHDKFLPGDKITPEERDAEMLEILQFIRLKFDQEVRIVYVCIRDRNDQFLGNIVGLGIHDIFHAETFSTDAFLKQLSSPPKFSNVQKFNRADVNLQQLQMDYEEEDTATQESSLEERERGEALPHSPEVEGETGLLGKVLGKWTPFKQKSSKHDENGSKEKPVETTSPKKNVEPVVAEETAATTIDPIEELLNHSSLPDEPSELDHLIQDLVINEESVPEVKDQKDVVESLANQVEPLTTTPIQSSAEPRPSRTERRTRSKSQAKEQSTNKDEKENVSTTVSNQEPENLLQGRELVTFGPVVVAVAALTGNSGVTSTSISIAKYLKSLSKRVAIIELNQSMGFERLHAFYENSFDLLFDADSFECEGIMHYKYRMGLQVHAIINQYDYVVLDMGLLSDTHTFISEYKRAPIRLMIIPNQNWKWYLVDRLQQQDPYALEDYTFLLPTSDEDIVKRFKKEFAVQNALAFPVLESLYDLTSEETTRIEQLLNRFFVAKKGKTKKRWFF